MKQSLKMVTGKSSEVKDMRMKPIPAYDHIFIPPSRVHRDKVSTTIVAPFEAHDGKSSIQDGQQQFEEELVVVSNDEGLQNANVAFNQNRFVQLLPEREIKPKEEKEFVKVKKQMKPSPKMVTRKSSKVKDMQMKSIPAYDHIFKPPSRVDRDKVSTTIIAPVVAFDAGSPIQDGQQQFEEEHVVVSINEGLQNENVAFYQSQIVQLLPQKEIKPKQEKDFVKFKKQMKESTKMVIGKSSEVKDMPMKPIPDYDQIFKPPSRVHRDPSKKYGKEALRLDFNSQYHTFMSNRRLLKDWLQEGGFYVAAPNLRSDMDAKMALKNLISLKYSNLAALNFDSITMRWQEKDIYATAKLMLQYSRKADGVHHEEVCAEDSNGEDSNVESHLVHLDTRTTLSSPSTEQTLEIATVLSQNQSGISMVQSKAFSMSSLELPSKIPEPFVVQYNSTSTHQTIEAARVISRNESGISMVQSKALNMSSSGLSSKNAEPSGVQEACVVLQNLNNDHCKPQILSLKALGTDYDKTNDKMGDVGKLVLATLPVSTISTRKRKADALSQASGSSKKKSSNESIIDSVAAAERVVLNEFGLMDVDLMYSKLKVYMREQNKLDTKRPFKNSLKLREEETLMKVAQYMVEKWDT